MFLYENVFVIMSLYAYAHGRYTTVCQNANDVPYAHIEYSLTLDCNGVYGFRDKGLYRDSATLRRP